MKYMILFLMLISTNAMARVSPEMAVAKCRNMGPDFKCSLIASDGGGAIMIVDRYNKHPSEAAKMQYLDARDSFFEAGGLVVELHEFNGTTGRFQSCIRAPRLRQGFYCDAAYEKNSFRKSKPPTE